MVFYFTGTGNSLYVAKQIEGNPVSIPQVMGQHRLEFTDDSIGIVAPIYGHQVPPMVQAFLKKAVFHTSYFYLLLTYGNRHGGAPELAKDLCQACGITPAYINVVLMADNWLPSFDMEEQKKADKDVPGQLTAILADPRARRRWIAPVSEADRAAHRDFLCRTSQMPAHLWQHLLRITEACIGCGICAMVCPSASIHMEEGKAVYLPGKCQTCLACAHACPQKAIGLTIPEKNPLARYRNEHISLQELVQANCQIAGDS